MTSATAENQPEYVPGPVERFGRKHKMEYVGMVSVYFVLFRLFFATLMPWHQALLAAVGMFFLFLGLKKKTRDHLSGSFLLFAVGAVAREPVAATD